MARHLSCRPAVWLALAACVAIDFASVAVASDPDDAGVGAAKPIQLFWWTTPPPDAVTTQPVDEVQPTSSVLLKLQEAIDTQLRSTHSQWINALIALAFGVVMVIDGETVFKWLVVGGVFIAATLIAHNEMAAFWSLGEKSWLRRFTGAEVGIIVAYNAWRGIEGLMIALAAGFGTFVAFGMQTALVSHGALVFKTLPWLVVLLYSLVVLGSVAMVVKKKHVRALGILSSMLGGALVSSALSWFVTNAFAHDWLRIKGIAASPGAWVDFFTLLTGSASEGHVYHDVGTFADTPGMNKFSSAGWPGDRICGCVLWFVLFVIGAFVQLRRAQKSKVTKVKIAAAREPLLPRVG